MTYDEQTKSFDFQKIEFPIVQGHTSSAWRSLACIDLEQLGIRFLKIKRFSLFIVSHEVDLKKSKSPVVATEISFFQIRGIPRLGGLLNTPLRRCTNFSARLRSLLHRLLRVFNKLSPSLVYVCNYLRCVVRSEGKTNFAKNAAKHFYGQKIKDYLGFLNQRSQGIYGCLVKHWLPGSSLLPGFIKLLRAIL